MWKRWLLAGSLAAAIAGCGAPMRAVRVPHTDAPGFVPMLASLTSSLIAKGRTTGFWYRPSLIYAARLAAIRKAKRTIHVETYFMTPGRRADDFARALVERAKAGVDVRFVADADGTKYLGPAYFERLKEGGVKVRRYNPLHAAWPWAYNTRTHRKLLTIDGEVAFTGGTGVSDEWDGAGGNVWADVEVRLVGPVVAAMEGVFAQHWMETGGTADLGPQVFKTGKEVGRPMLVTASGPRYAAASPMRTLYHASILAARKRIWIASPYFLPGREDMRALIRAKKRGVDVRILSVGPKNDQAFTYWAVQEHSGPLLAAGIPILEYQPAMMHAKVMLIDDDWVVTGSANFDPRSFFHNDELTIAGSDPVLGAQAEAFFKDAWPRTRPLTMDDLAGRGLWRRAQSRAALAIWWWL